MEKLINMELYPRKSHFEYFCSLPNPHVGLTAEVDVTGLAELCKEKQCSFYLLFIHAAALAAEAIPEFRQRIHDNGILEYEQCPTSHTESLPDGTYCYCTLKHHMPLKDYLEYAEKQRKACREKASIEEDDSVDSQLFISCVPWVHYTAIVQPTSGNRDSNPRITWGKYEKDLRGRMMMPVSVLCHHALVDGLQIGMFYRNLEEELRKITEEGRQLEI